MRAGRPRPAGDGLDDPGVVGLGVAGAIGVGMGRGSRCPARSFVLVCYWALASVPTRGLESRRAKESAK